MLELYIGNKNYSSWSLRPWALMRELRIPFTERLVPFQGTDNAERFRRFSPSGKVPCLIDGETVVWDSLAIAEYLNENFPGVWPAVPAARAWARCAAAEMHSGFSALRSHCSMNCGVRVRLHRHPAELGADVGRVDALWTEGLSRFGGPYLAGAAYTAVDAFFAPVVFRVQTYGLQLSAVAGAYAAAALALTSMREWYEAALQETWRDAAHEVEVQDAGVWTADLRSG